MSALDKLDPTKVPLPNGTEVGTRRDLYIENSDSKYIPQGAVGRVKETREDGLIRVLIPGRGEYLYEREDLLPRKEGQLKFAVDRDAAYAQFRPHVIYEALVGSRAWGLSDENSDSDTRGVFVWPQETQWGFQDPTDTIQSLDNSNSFWEIKKTIQQALRADPNTLEMLYVPEYKTTSIIGSQLRNHRDRFASQEIYGSFGRYALAQSKKMRQSMRLAQHRSILLEWLKESPGDTLNYTAQRLFDATLPNERDGYQKAKSYIKQLYISLFDQGLLEGASFEHLVSFAQTDWEELDMPRELRPKNAYNLLRIVSSAVHWLRTGEPIIKTEGELNTKLWSIKRGDVDLETALTWTEDAAKNLEDARANSVLPEKPDYEAAENLLRNARRLKNQEGEVVVL